MRSILAVVRSLHQEESGQDLIEYALIAALVAFGAIIGMSSLASGLNSAFDGIVSKIGVYIK